MATMNACKVGRRRVTFARAARSGLLHGGCALQLGHHLRTAWERGNSALVECLEEIATHVLVPSVLC